MSIDNAYFSFLLRYFRRRTCENNSGISFLSIIQLVNKLSKSLFIQLQQFIQLFRKMVENKLKNTDCKTSFSINSKLLVLIIDVPEANIKIQVTFQGQIYLVTEEMIKTQKIYTQPVLAKHVKENFQIPFEFVLISDNENILTPTSRVYPLPDVLQLKVFYKYIKNKDKKESDEKKDKTVSRQMYYTSFFNQRDIVILEDILKVSRFEKCIEDLKCEFTLPDQGLDTFKQDIWQTFMSNEACKGSLIRKVIEFAVKAYPFLQIEDQYRITLDKRYVTADHAILEVFGARSILILEDKYSSRDMVEGLLQNFDQAQLYSLTKYGKHYPFVYGIISNFHEWRFSCYYLPSLGRTETIRNFYTSQIFTLINQGFNISSSKQVIEAFKNLKENLNSLIGSIRGILREDVDTIVSQT